MNCTAPCTKLGANTWAGAAVAPLPRAHALARTPLLVHVVETPTYPHVLIIKAGPRGRGCPRYLYVRTSATCPAPHVLIIKAGPRGRGCPRYLVPVRIASATCPAPRVLIIKAAQEDQGEAALATCISRRRPA